MRYVSLLLLAFLIPSVVPAQGPVLPLKDKTVAVYFSKKHFSFNQYFYHDVAQFIKTDAGDDVLIEDSKLQAIIALGALFSDQLAEPTEAKEVFFLNGRPELAREFIRNYAAAERRLSPLPTVSKEVDYILVVNPVNLVMERVPAVLTRSNRLVTTHDLVKTGQLRLDLFDPMSGDRVSTTRVCVNDRETFIPNEMFTFYPEESRMGEFLGKVFSLAVTNLNLGEVGNCPLPKESN